MSVAEDVATWIATLELGSGAEKLKLSGKQLHGFMLMKQRSLEELTKSLKSEFGMDLLSISMFLTGLDELAVRAQVK